METAIVILNWNGIDFLKKFIDNTLQCSFSDKSTIYVADNGSTDNSVTWLKKNHPGIRTIKLDKNYGFAEGYNRALSMINAKYFILLNSDIEVTPGWDKQLVDFMENHPEAASAQPKIHSYRDKDRFEYAGAGGGYIDKYGYPLCRGRIFHITETDNNQYDSPWEIFWATGACTIIRSEAWKICGGFDNDFFAHMEEIDLCWRFHRAGYKVGLVKDVTVHHIGGGTLPYKSPFKTYLNFRNGLYLLYKNLPDNGFKKIMFKRKLLDGLAFLFFLAKFQFSSAFSVIKAHCDYYGHLSTLKEKRSETRKIGADSPTGPIIDKSIVFQFYFKYNRTFSKIASYSNPFSPR